MKGIWLATREELSLICKYNNRVWRFFMEPLFQDEYINVREGDFERCVARLFMYLKSRMLTIDSNT